MYCNNCGKQSPEGSKFCTECGAVFEVQAKPVDENTVKPQEQPAQPTAVYVQPEYQNYGQSQYQQQYYAPQHDPRTAPLSIGDFFVIWIVSIIPIVNIIMLFVWAFGNGENYNRRSYARFYLILFLIGFILSIVGGILIAISGYSLAAIMQSQRFY